MHLKLIQAPILISDTIKVFKLIAHILAILLKTVTMFEFFLHV